MKLKELTYAVIGSCMRVHSSLGPGLLEACYHNALYYQLKNDGLSVQADVPFEVTHLGYPVGQYYADLVAALCAGRVGPPVVSSQIITRESGDAERIAPA